MPLICSSRSIKATSLDILREVKQVSAVLGKYWWSTARNIVNPLFTLEFMARVITYVSIPTATIWSAWHLLYVHKLTLKMLTVAKLSSLSSSAHGWIMTFIKSQTARSLDTLLALRLLEEVHQNCRLISCTNYKQTRSFLEFKRWTSISS